VGFSQAATEERLHQESVLVPPHLSSQYRHTPLWAALQSAIAELTASQEISVNTAPEYVIEHLCRELVAKKLVADPAAG
jgi:hypothetical protein